MPICIDKRLIAKLVLQMDPQRLYPIRSRIRRRYPRQIAQNVQDGPLIGRFFEVFGAIRVDIGCFIEDGLGLGDLLLGVDLAADAVI